MAEGRSRSEPGPTGLEWWLGYAALLATALVPNLTKFGPSDATPNSSLDEFLWSVLYILAASRLLTSRDIFVPLFRRSIVLWAFVFLMVLSTSWSVNASVTFKQSVELVGTTVVASYFVLRYTLSGLLHLFGLAFGSLGLLSLLFIFFAPGRGRVDWGSGAWSGIFQEKNLLGAAMVLAIITLAASLFAGSRRRRLLAAAMLALCAALLAGARSATAFTAGSAALLLGFIAWFWWSPRTRSFGRSFVAVIGAVATLSIATYGFHPDAAIEMLGRDSSLTGRTDFWPYLIQAIKDRPILGFGYNAFFASPEGADYLSYFTAVGFTPYHAHNSFLMVCLDSGLVGIALLTVLVFTALVRSVRYLAKEGSFMAAWPLMIVLYLVLGSYTETYLCNYNTFEWIFFVAALLYPLRASARVPDSADKAFTPTYRMHVAPSARAGTQ